MLKDQLREIVEKREAERKENEMMRQKEWCEIARALFEEIKAKLEEEVNKGTFVQWAGERWVSVLIKSDKLVEEDSDFMEIGALKWEYTRYIVRHGIVKELEKLLKEENIEIYESGIEYKRGKGKYKRTKDDGCVENKFPRLAEVSEAKYYAMCRISF